mgnify:CR=1 FL=1
MIFLLYYLIFGNASSDYGYKSGQNLKGKYEGCNIEKAYDYDCIYLYGSDNVLRAGGLFVASSGENIALWTEGLTKRYDLKQYEVVFKPAEKSDISK